MLLLLLSKPRPVLQSLCFSPSLLLFYSPPSILLLYCECFLCSLQAVSRDFWPMCSANCMRAVGWGWGDSTEAVMSKHCHSFPTVFKLCRLPM